MTPEDVLDQGRSINEANAGRSYSLVSAALTRAKPRNRRATDNIVERPFRPWRVLSLLLILIAGTTLSLLAYIEAAHRDNERITAVLNLQAGWRIQDLKQKVEDAAIPIEAVADFLATHRDATADEFRTFAARARGSDPIVRLAWVPWVAGPDRAEIERIGQQKNPGAHYVIRSGSAQGLVEEPPRPEYAPVLFEEDFDGAQSSIGLDFLSEPSRRAAALRARDEGKPIATTPVQTFFGDPSERRLLLFWPVYLNDNADSVDSRREAFLGFVMGSFVGRELIKWSLDGTPDLPETLSLIVGDAAGPNAEAPLGIYLPSTRTIDTHAPSLPVAGPNDVRLLRSFELFGRNWTAVSDFPDAYISRIASPARWLYLVVGLILTTMLSGYVFVEQRRRIAIEGVVAQRTGALRQSNEHLQRVQSIARIGSLEIDMSSQRTITWSDEIYRLMGVEPGEVEPAVETFIAASHPDDRGKLRNLVDRNLRGEEVDPWVFRVIVPSGEVRWIERNADFVRDDAGKPVTLVVTLYDVTERKQMIEELRRSREHLAKAQSAGLIGSCEINLFTRETIWSEEMYRLWDLDPSGPVPEFARQLQHVHPDDRGRIAELDRMSLAGIEADPCDFRVLRADGGIRWLNRQAVFIRDSDGSPESVIISNQDVTLRIEAESDLRQTKTLLAGIVESSDDAIISKSLDGTITSWNAAAERVFGYSADEIVGKNISILAPPDLENEIPDILQRIARGERVAHYETRRVHKDGTILDISLAVSPIYDGTGRIIGASKVARDITAVKEAGARRQQLEAQLRQLQKMEAIGQLTGGVSHDFNNLLTVIVGRLELIETELDANSVARDWVRSCFNAAKRGATLTRSLLSFSRQQPLTPAVIDIGAAIEEVVGLLPRTLGETIDVKAKTAPGLWRCEVDPGQLQNALLNLALNARDAMSGGGKLTIEASNSHLDSDYTAINAGVRPGDYVTLSVTDTGCGMPPEVVARAFDPFYTTKEFGKGSGLGLSMVYGFASQSGGHVKIYSEVGLGTTVRLYLPRCKAAPADIDAQPIKLAQSAGHETILIVEDDDDMRALTATQLLRLGYSVHTAANAAEALRLTDEHPEIALLLTDLTLPGGMNGRDLAERAQALMPRLRVLYMSGYTEDAIMHQGRLAPNVRMLQKPFGIRDLAESIRAVLSDA